jgi:hypothetical protein
MVAGATRCVATASGATPDSGVCFPSELSVEAGAFALSQVLDFGSLSYIANCYGELRPHHGVVPAGNEPSVSSPSPGLLGADLEVLALQIRRGLGPNPAVLERC